MAGVKLDRFNFRIHRLFFLHGFSFRFFAFLSVLLFLSVAFSVLLSLAMSFSTLPIFIFSFSRLVLLLPVALLVVAVFAVLLKIVLFGFPVFFVCFVPGISAVLLVILASLVLLLGHFLPELLHRFHVEFLSFLSFFFLPKLLQSFHVEFLSVTVFLLPEL